MRSLKILAWISGSIVLLAIVSAGLYFFFMASETDIEAKPTLAVKEDTNPKGESFIQVIETEETDLAEEFPMDMPEFDIQEAIHGMTHQKIIAEDKWGFIPLTEQRVQRLAAVVEKNIAKYENAELYQNILNKWAKYDFLTVDEDHNSIWELQGGTIGEATGILSAEEEKKFIKEHYDIDE
ncbi:DUF6241 domain-containing protein [Peribacillus sp. SCS-155]|uniref:DUF6241 domain-containing protein n=1 Tax=Peribacillus sedimenti TaxID=3115297 RepID=UPI0039068E22